MHFGFLKKYMVAQKFCNTILMFGDLNAHNAAFPRLCLYFKFVRVPGTSRGECSKSEIFLKAQSDIYLPKLEWLLLNSSNDLLK